MTVLWAIRMIVAGALIAAAAAAGERAVVRLRAPRRWIWVAALLVATAFPVITLWRSPAPGIGMVDRIVDAAIGWSEPRASADRAPTIAAPNSVVSVAASRSNASGTAAPASNASPDGGMRTVLVMVWVLTSASLLVLFAASYMGVRRRMATLEIRRFDEVDLAVADDWGPLVVGLRRPRIVVPGWLSELSSEDQRLIVSHETEHVRAGDQWVLGVAAACVAIVPWSPAVWWIQRQLRTAVEIDCDRRVLARGIDRRAYGHTLLRVGQRRATRWTFAPGWSIRGSVLRARIRSIAAGSARRSVARALPAFAATLLLATCARLAAVPRDATNATAGFEIAGAAESVVAMRVTTRGSAARLVWAGGSLTLDARQSVEVTTPAALYPEAPLRYDFRIETTDPQERVTLRAVGLAGEDIGSARGSRITMFSNSRGNGYTAQSFADFSGGAKR